MGLVASSAPWGWRRQDREDGDIEIGWSDRPFYLAECFIKQTNYNNSFLLDLTDVTQSSIRLIESTVRVVVLVRSCRRRVDVLFMRIGFAP